jgi:hypothetical protein
VRKLGPLPNLETQICLKKSSFPEPLRNIEQPHSSSSESDISFISERQARLKELPPHDCLSRLSFLAHGAAVPDEEAQQVCIPASIIDSPAGVFDLAQPFRRIMLDIAFPVASARTASDHRH